jgi:hypothetical protein
VGGASPDDWATFGLEPGAGQDAIRARWREHAKRLHPDAGGDAAAFVAMQAAYHRLLAAEAVEVRSLPDPAEIFDPVIVNPTKGFFDFYSTKLWPGAVVLILVAGMLSPRTPGTSGIGTTSGSNPSWTTPTLAPARPAAAGTAHRCWYTGSALNGCQDDTTSTMLFGSQIGLVTTCWFEEPLDNGEYANCQ